jgi:hypothetical protein
MLTTYQNTYLGEYDTGPSYYMMQDFQTVEILIKISTFKLLKYNTDSVYYL